jgi:hypothetical protein
LFELFNKNEKERAFTSDAREVDELTQQIHASGEEEAVNIVKEVKVIIGTRTMEEVESGKLNTFSFASLHV